MERFLDLMDSRRDLTSDKSFDLVSMAAKSTEDEDFMA